MTKEEILAKSRDENRNGDLIDLEVQSKAAKVGIFVSFLLCAVISIVEFVFTKKVSVQCWMVFFGITATIFLIKFIKIHKKHELFVFICYLVVFILLSIRFIFTLLGKA